MNSIFFIFGCFSAILAVTAPYVSLSFVHSTFYSKEVILTPPFYYGYQWGALTNVRVNFNNLSPGVVYTVYEACEAGTFESSKKVLNSPAGTDVYLIKKHVMSELILIYVELITSSAGWCKNITIFEGRALPRFRNGKVVPGYEYNDMCLGSSPSCTIQANLSNECTGTPSNEPPQTTSAKRESVDSAILDNNTLKPNVTTSPQNENIQNTTAGDNKNNEQQQFSPNVLIYVIPSMIGMCVIIILIYGVKKYCHQNSHTEEPMELNTYATTNQVVYAELSLLNGDSQPPRLEEESPYAKIIGVMKPVDENVRKKTP